MRHDLPLLASLIFDTPLLIHRKKADTILSAIGPRIMDGFELRPADVELPKVEARTGDGARRFRQGGYVYGNGIAVLPVLGTLIRRGSWLDAESGLMSYARIGDSVTEILTDPSVRGLMVEYDTPGGESSGCFDLSRHIGEVSERTGKPVWAHVNEVAASAGYALASAAEQIWIPTTGEVGSIGVLAAHIDASEADKKAGLKWTYIYAGDEKVDGNPHEPLSDRARASIQADVDALYSMFVDLVSQHRGIDAETIRDTKAAMYRGVDAIESGLADEFGTFDQALEAFAERVDELQTPTGRKAMASKTKVELMSGNRSRITAASEEDKEVGTGKEKAKTKESAAEDGEEDEEDMKGKDKAKAAAPAAPSSSASAQDDPVAAERQRCAGLQALAAQADRLGVAFNAAEAINSGMGLELARTKVLDAAAAGDAQETTAVAVPKARSDAPAAPSDPAAKKAMWKKAMKRR